MNARDDFFSNFIWRFAERWGAQIITFLVSIILARLLEPDVYGTITIVVIFIEIMQVFVDSGLGNALIQKKSTDDLDFSTVFYFNIVFCICIYAVIYIISPKIGCFFKDDNICKYIRCSGIIIIVSGIKNVQQAYVTKNMIFKKFFYSSIGGTVISAIIGIFMALYGFGIWSLIVQQLSNTIIDTIILWFIVPWRPRRIFSFDRFKILYSYGWKLLLSKIIDTCYNNVRQLVIGKVYSSADLAYYNRAQQIPQTVILNFNSAIDSVLFPTMSQKQDNIIIIKEITQKAIKTTSYIIWPLMIGIFVIADYLVRVLLTSKWLGCVPYLRIFCINFAFYPIHTANLNAMKALGRSDYYLIAEIVKKIMGITLLLLTMHKGVFAVACTLLITTLLSCFINAYPNRKLLNYKFYEQIIDILPALLLAVFMGICIYPLRYLYANYILKMILQIIVGIIIYIAGSKILKYKSYYYIVNILKTIIKRIRKI